jgi:hypothetical protein
MKDPRLVRSEGPSCIGTVPKIGAEPSLSPESPWMFSHAYSRAGSGRNRGHCDARRQHYFEKRQGSIKSTNQRCR